MDAVKGANYEKESHQMKRILAISSVFLITAAQATERSYHQTEMSAPVVAPSASAVGGSGGQGGAGGSVGSITSRTTVVGTSASSNNATCDTPILFGLVVWESPTCALPRLANELRARGEADAADEILCMDQRVRDARRKVGRPCRD